jgi:hypothetical protein
VRHHRKNATEKTKINTISKPSNVKAMPMGSSMDQNAALLPINQQCNLMQGTEVPEEFRIKT